MSEFVDSRNGRKNPYLLYPANRVSPVCRDNLDFLVWQGFFPLLYKPRDVFFFAPAVPMVRVALQISASHVEVSSKSRFTVQFSDRFSGVKKISSGRDLSFWTDGHRIFVSGKPETTGSLDLFSESPMIFQKRKYSGMFRILIDHGYLDVINVLDMEEYIAGVVGAEISSVWPEEALKAQAVVTRTYASWKMEKRKDAPFDLLSTTEDQVYDGLESVTSAARKAAQETRGEVIAYQGKLIEAYYHADCGGRTENGENVFSETSPYLQSVVCPFGKDSPYRIWKKTYSFLEFSEQIGKPVRDFSIRQRDDANRVSSVTLKTQNGEETLSSVDLRRFLGAQNLRSTQFIIQKEQESVLIPRIEEVSGKEVRVKVPSFVFRSVPVLAVARLSSASPVLLIYKNGALMKAEFSSENPLVVVASHGFLASASENMSSVSFQKKLEKRKILIPQFRPGKREKKIVMMPVKVPVSVTFIGHGWGHGVGLCQWGARGMAQLGKTYQEILHYYYRGVQLTKI